MATDFYDTSYDIQGAAARRQRALRSLASQQQLESLGLVMPQRLADVSRQFAAGLEPRVSGYARRGLGQSGLFQRAMKDYATAQQRAIGDIFAQQQQAIGQENINQQAADIELQNAIDRLNYEKQQQIIADAARLADFTGYFG